MGNYSVVGPGFNSTSPDKVNLISEFIADIKSEYACGLGSRKRHVIVFVTVRIKFTNLRENKEQFRCHVRMLPPSPVVDTRFCQSYIPQMLLSVDA